MPTPPPTRRWPLLCLCLCLSAPAAALELRRVEILGLDDETQQANVAGALSVERLNPARRRNLTESRLSYLLRRAPREARQALEPFGLYEPTVETELRREGELVDVIVRIVPGEPVRVAGREIAMTGAAESDTVLQRRLQRLRPRTGEVFNHAVYEAGKAVVERSLAERGYFDWELQRHQVTVNRAARRADIDLAWDSGRRYALGQATFSGHGFRPGLLENLVPWTPGEPYDQRELLRLQASLAELDYFGSIEVRPLPEQAEDGVLPVQVDLTAAKRTRYEAGVRYGTDTGLGLSGGMERRWVNDRGHKLRAQVGLAERRNDLAVQYRIPAFKWLDGWYTFGASAREESLEFVNSEQIDLIAGRSGKLGDWNLVAALNARRERFEDPLTGADYSYSTLVYGSLWAQWWRADDLLYPRRAHGLTLELRGGSTGLGSDIDFVQVRAEGRFVRQLGPRNRLLLRAEAGTTISDQFPQFPPSLRFYAGGDRSVRGYGYKEIGQYFEDINGDRYVFGGKHLLVASVEYERMFTREWGAAVFVDAGDAFDSRASFDWEVGAGVGLRWRSPVGPVRIDVAHGFGDAAQQSVRLHLNIGPDL